MVARHAEMKYEGPLPPAGQFREYNEILPGAADRILAMAESNAMHRQELERSVVHGNVVAQARGQMFAFILAVLILILGGWLMLAGTDGTVGFWLITGDLICLAVVFLTGRILQGRERRGRRRDLAGR